MSREALDRALRRREEIKRALKEKEGTVETPLERLFRAVEKSADPALRNALDEYLNEEKPDEEALAREFSEYDKLYGEKLSNPDFKVDKITASTVHRTLDEWKKVAGTGPGMGGSTWEIPGYPDPEKAYDIWFKGLSRPKKAM